MLAWCCERGRSFGEELSSQRDEEVVNNIVCSGQRSRNQGEINGAKRIKVVVIVGGDGQDSGCSRAGMTLCGGKRLVQECFKLPGLV